MLKHFPDIKKINPTMFDSEILDVIVHNQIVVDTKLNYMHKMMSQCFSTDRLSMNGALEDTLAEVSHTEDVEEVVRRPIKKVVDDDQMHFSQIPVRNNDEFLSLEAELKENPESVIGFENMLETLGSPENYSEFIKRITSKLFTPNFMEQLGWAQIGVGGLQLKETTIKESIYNVFAKKYDGIQEDMLNEKFSQHFRSFRLNRNKVRPFYYEIIGA